MPTFNRFDICEAYFVLEMEWNVGGWLYERPSNRRRRESTGIQLDRIGFKPSMCFCGFESLSENAKEIYEDCIERYKLK